MSPLFLESDRGAIASRRSCNHAEASSGAISTTRVTLRVAFLACQDQVGDKGEFIPKCIGYIVLVDQARNGR